jgi:hypothetical protein
MERPILFNTEMVRAILEGRKTMTRRVVKPQPDSVRRSAFVQSGFETCHGYEIKIPYKPGDTLWVRETWLKNAPGGISKYFYKADAPEEVLGQAKAFGYKWRPSTHMPRKAARLFLTVKNVRVEQLQEITEEDARAEGVPWEYSLPDGITKELFESRVGRIGFCEALESIGGQFNYKRGFQLLWDSLNAKRGYSWDANPWVWVVEFERRQ